MRTQGQGRAARVLGSCTRVGDPGGAPASARPALAWATSLPPGRGGWRCVGRDTQAQGRPCAPPSWTLGKADFRATPWPRLRPQDPRRRRLAPAGWAQHRPAPPLGGAGSGSPGQRCRTHRSAVGAHSSAGPELRGQGRAARPVLPASAGPGTTATALPPASSGRRALRWRPRRRGSAQPPGGSAPRRASRGNGRSKTAIEKKRGPASSRERGPPMPPKSLSRDDGGAAFLPIT